MSIITDQSQNPGKRIVKADYEDAPVAWLDDDTWHDWPPPVAPSDDDTGQWPDDDTWQSGQWADSDDTRQSDAAPVEESDAAPDAKPKWQTCRECRRRTRQPLQGGGLCRYCYGRATAIKTAASWLADNPLFLEVNSTGLGDADQIVEIALLDSGGKALLNTLVKPAVPMTAEATALNGLTDGALAAAPNFAAVGPTLYALLAGRRVVVYDVRFDTRLLAQSDNVFNLVEPPGITWACAMELYAQYTGLWNAHFENYRWQKLADAATWFNLQLPAPRRAACGAETTRKLLRFMAGVETPPEAAQADDDEPGGWQW